MAQTPKSIKAELVLRFPSGKETKLGDVEIETHARYEFSFQKRVDVPLAEATVTESYARIAKEE